LKTDRIGIILCAALAIVLLTSGLALAKKSKGRTYTVTITNLTKAQVLTPPILVSHQGSFALFSPGELASDELAALAEGGNTLPLSALLGTREDIYDVVFTGDPILPGTSVTLEIKSRGSFNRLSLAGMLATTNDGFFAINGSIFPPLSQTLTAGAYDAGSEANTEACSDIPGPPCDPDSGNLRVTAGAEGFVHVHNGIHGTGDLNAANLDWRNPVAKIHIVKEE